MSAPRRVAAIDVGTNTVLLLIAEGDAHAPSAVLELATITRLGQEVDRTGRLRDDAIERTLACLSHYGAVAREHGVVDLSAVCTSAARDAENGSSFLARATDALGVAPSIVSGDAEARLTFDGALTGLSLVGDVTVFDVGGGSTEIIHGTVGEDGATIRTAASLDIGSVRLTERHVRSDPPSRGELALVRADIERALTCVRAHPTTQVVGVAGTVTTLASIDQNLSVYDPARVHGSILSRRVISRIAAELGALSLDERRAVTGLQPARADVIIAGAHLVLAVLDWASSPTLRVSDRGVRWGLARALLLSRA